MEHCKAACDMRGFLSLLVMHLLAKEPMSGAQLAREIEKRKGCKPNPGTIYPALKELVRKNVIEAKSKDGKEKVYKLTASGKKELEAARNSFCKIFYDLFTR